MKAKEIYALLKKELAENFPETAEYEARETMEMLFHAPHDNFPIYLMDGELPAESLHMALAVIDRRKSGEPLAYILKKTWFYGLPFTVTPDCLIPQADTEIVTEALIKRLHPGMTFADICTGSGCIALAALQNSENTKAYAYDLSENALKVAMTNAENLGLADRITFCHADVFADDFLQDMCFDTVVSNPPYIARDVIPTLTKEVQMEPHMALDGGESGLDFYERLLDICPRHIKKGGFLLLEIGYDQKDSVGNLCKTRGLTYECYSDFGGNDRVIAVLL